MKESQKELIHSSEWDVLIVLDACRYDYFEEVHSEYLVGSLKKVTSPGSCTTEWLKKNFQKNSLEEVVYLSANPHINSKTPVEGFYSKNKFFRIIDIWDYGWNENRGMVPPKKVSRKLLELIKTTNRRIIAHYLQPHAPYIGFESGESGRAILQTRGKTIQWSVGRVLSWLETKVFFPLSLLRLLYQFRLNLGIRVGPEKKTYAKFGLNEFKRAYERNLKFCLSSISKMIPEKFIKEKNIVITSDHGELLGDKISNVNNKLRIGHAEKSKNPVLKEVPWFEIEAKKKESTERSRIKKTGSVENIPYS